MQLHIYSNFYPRQYTRAGFLLRELQNEGKIVKEGRGVEARWIKSQLQVTVVQS